MKTSLAILTAVLLTSCDGTLPTVNNRDSSGRFITPDCPKCGAAAARSGTVYECASGHEYRTELTNTKSQ